MTESSRKDGVPELERPTHSASLAELYERHWPEASRLAYLLTGDRQGAEDLAQDAFARLIGRFVHLRNREAFGAYLRKTLVNLHVSRLRRLRLERAFLRSAGRERAEDRQPDVAVRGDLWAALQALPRRQRVAVVLRYYEDLSERDTADHLRCSVAAVKSLTARAMRTLRDELAGWGS